MKITSRAVHLFEFALTSSTWTIEDAGAALGSCAGEVAELLEELELLSLVRRNPGACSGWELVSPRRATSAVLAAEQRELLRREAETAQLHGVLQGLEHTYQRARATLPSRTASCVVERDRTMLEVLADTIHLARSEVRVAHASTRPDERSLDTTLEESLTAVRRGVSVKVLLQHTARSHLSVRKQVTTLVDAGATVRTLAVVPTRIAFIDDECAVVPHGEDSGETSLVHEPGLVSHLAAGFEAHWSSSRDFPVGVPTNGLAVEPETRAELRQKIVELLAQGATDEAVARKLRVSPRTARRHVADLMRCLGAASRFQAGVLVGRDGLLGAGSP